MWFNKPLTHIVPLSLSDGATYERKLNWVYRYIVDWIVPQLDDKLDKWFKQYKADHEALLKDISDTKDSWENLFNQFMADVTAQLEALNDQAMANLIRRSTSETRKALDELFNAAEISFDAKLADKADKTTVISQGKLIAELQSGKMDKGSLVYNVMDYGAKGDGTADDTAAFQACADAMVRGGIMFAPARKYLINGEVVVKFDNVHVVQFGAEFVKSSASTSYVVYALLAGSNTGRSSGVRNFKVSGGTLRGNLAGNVTINLVTAHRASGIELQGVDMVEYASNGHAVDLMGCDNVWIHHSRFRGCKPLAGREYTEAIQIDSSIRQGAGWSAANVSRETYDGTQTVDVVVENCVFEGSGAYPAQSPLGSHTWVIGKPMSGIAFRNNVVKDVVSTVTSTYPAVLHFIGTTGVEVVGNHFENPNGRLNRVVRANRGERGIPLSQVSAEVPVWVDANENTVNMSDFYMFDNDVVGFTDTSADAPHLIHFYGRDDFSLDNIVIRENRFKRCQTGGAASGYIVQLGDTTSSAVYDNSYDSANGFCYVGKSKFPLVYNNRGTGNTHYPVNVKECEYPRVFDNHAYNHDKGFVITECLHPYVAGNTVEVVTNYAGIQIIGTPPAGSVFTLSNNMVIGVGAKTANGIQATPTNYPKGSAVGNVVKGYGGTSYVLASTVDQAANVTA